MYYLFKLSADKFECGEDGLRSACDSDNAFRTGAIADVDLRSGL